MFRKPKTGMKWRVLLLLPFVAIGCATVSTAQRLNQQGNHAFVSGNYQLAREQYQEALVESEKTGDQQYMAIAMYGLGRSNGHLCNFPEAEAWFLKSISLREKLEDSRGAYLSQNLLELARLYVSQKKYSDAVVEFDRAVPILETLNSEAHDPIAYADVLEDYEHSLRQSGKVADAERVKERIEHLRKAYSSRKARFKIKPYPTNCS